MISRETRSGPSRPDAVFFGNNTTARIESITENVLRYIDSEGNPHEIALQECGRGKLVGDRYLDKPPWTVLFFDAGKTRMEFESYVMVHQHLLSPLGRQGWHTFDRT